MIHQKFANSITPIGNSVGVAIDRDFAIVPATAIEEVKNLSIVALDSRLNLAIVKLNTEKTPVTFSVQESGDDVFILYTFFENPAIVLVKGYTEDGKIKIEGKYPLGSLLLSLDLNPIGIITKAGAISETLIIRPIYSQISKLINRKPGWLGLQAQTIGEDLKKFLSAPEGIVITNIYEGGPSEKAGLRRGDIIVGADDIKIRDLKDLQNFLSTKFAGEKINLRVIKDGSQLTIPVLLEESPFQVLQTKPLPLIPTIKGLIVTEIPESSRRYLPKSIKGVFVRKIEEDSSALGILKEEDIIVEVNRKPITNIKDYEDTLAQALTKDLLILVYRKDSFQYVIIPSQKAR